MGPYFFHDFSFAYVYCISFSIITHYVLLSYLFYQTKCHCFQCTVYKVSLLSIANLTTLCNLSFPTWKISVVLSSLYYVCWQVVGIWIEIRFVVVVGWQLHCVDCWDFSDSFRNGFVLFWLVQKFLCLKAFLLLYIRDIILAGSWQAIAVWNEGNIFLWGNLIRVKMSSK